jgi:hypothetical protein
MNASRKLINMKYISFILLALSLACNQSTTSSVARVSKYEHLLSKFKEISFDTLEVYSMGEEGEKNYKYNGVQLDSVDAVLFPTEIAKAHFMDPPGLFACFKFNIDSARTGLIARTPSEYYPSSIKLFIYESVKDTLEEFSELAEYIGDEGVVRDVNSWLFKDSSNNVQAFTWIHDSEDNSVEDENDTTISNTNSFLLSNISKNNRKEIDSAITKLPSNLKRLVIANTNR